MASEKHTVICIDDEEHNNQALERLLRKQYRVFTATDPAQGLKLIEQLQPTIIISDQRMPEMTGVELLKKSTEISPHSVRLLLTGYTDLESVISAINEGEIYRYLTKPWEPADLLATIQQAIETFDLRQEVRRQNEALKSLDKLKTEFMLLISHELRTPLTGIVSFLELLKEELKNEEHLLFCQHIEKNVERMKELVEDVLLITKFKTAATAFEESNVDIKKIVESSWEAQDNTSQLQLAFKGAFDVVPSTSAILKKILFKLIENCFEHAKEQSTVSVSFEDSAVDWSLEFKNTSENKLPEDANQLITSFQKNEDIMNHTQGTGLGLSVAQSLTHHLKGTMDVKTDGHDFYLKLTFPKSL